MRREKILLDTSESDRVEDEEPSLYDLKKLRRHGTLAILRVQDSLGNIVTRLQDISKIFLKYLLKKFGPIDIDGDCFHRLQGHVQQLCPTTAKCLEQPIILEEVIAAIRSRARHKTPGSDSICLELYSGNWETVHMDLKLLNQMFLHKNITDRQKHGVLICLPKSGGDNTSNGYRPMSLLNTDFWRGCWPHVSGRSWLNKSNTQFCGDPDNCILDAASQGS
jgi:hypothetical protein